MTLSVNLSALDKRVVARVTQQVDPERCSEDLSAAQAKAIIVEKGLWTPKGAKPNSVGSGEARPKRSLTADDFKDGPSKVRARTLAIAREQTDTVARGRIGSMGLMIPGCNTFEKWWNQADSESKLRLFTDKKHFDSIPSPARSHFHEAVPVCPFRGTVPTPQEEE
jgi:hypothetical protein